MSETKKRLELDLRPPEPKNWEPGDDDPFGGPRTEDLNIKLGLEEKEFWRKFAEEAGLDAPKLIRRAMYFYYECYSARHEILNQKDLIIDLATMVAKKISNIKGT